MMGDKGVTPTLEENAMFHAQSAAVKSGCLSKQVGAAIVDENGNLLATGCNDVPKAGGGLYSIENGEDDSRCMFKRGVIADFGLVRNIIHAGGDGVGYSDRKGDATGCAGLYRPKAVGILVGCAYLLPAGGAVGTEASIVRHCFGNDHPGGGGRVIFVSKRIGNQVARSSRKAAI